MENRKNSCNHSIMNFRREKLALATVVVLVFCQELIGVLSSAVPYAIKPPETYLPTVNDATGEYNLGYFGQDDYATVSNNKCNSTKDKPEIVDELVGGDYAKIGQFPWMAVVHRLLGNGRISMCGGTIISARWILTAGHCVEGQPRKFFIVLGETDKSGIGYDFYKGQGISMVTSQGALHPQYGTTINDIALLKMERDIKFSAAIKPIRLAGASAPSFADKIAIVVGWGRDGPQSSGTKRLKYISIPIMPNSKCVKIWPMVDETTICTVSGTGQDACQGDSGGPLIIKSGRETLQIGIVSYGDSDCPSSRPGVFTRVSAFIDWIEKVTGITYD